MEMHWSDMLKALDMAAAMSGCGTPVMFHDSAVIETIFQSTASVIPS